MTVNKITNAPTNNEVIDKINEVIDNLGSSITVDSALSTTSENPVQNKVITNSLVNYENLIEVTYSELVTLKTGGNLIEGAFYRITDYVTTSNGHSPNSSEPSRSVGHPFDIIIQAIGTNNLSEIGTAALHSGDTYFATENLGAWQIWYDINNDSNKYKWADSTNGKGVIYRLIDEKNNDFPYDFKNIQFYRDNTLSKYSTIASYLTASDGYYYTFSYNNNGTISDYSIVGTTYCKANYVNGGHGMGSGQALNNIIWVTTATAIVIGNNRYGIDCRSNTHAGLVDSNTFGAQAYNNVINNYTYGNIIGGECHDNIFPAQLQYNLIIGNCYNNSFSTGTAFYGNTVNDGFNNNSFTAGNIYANYFGAFFQNNTIKNSFFRNIFGGYCNGNTFNGRFANATVGGTFTNNTFSSTADYLTIGNAVQYNSFGGALANVTLGSYCQYITTSGILYHSTIGNMVIFITIPANTQGLNIGNLVRGSSDANKLDLTGIPTGATYQIYVVKGCNDEVVAKWNDGANETGLIKATVTTSSWSDLLPTYSWS